jgi:hypothetical protein
MKAIIFELAFISVAIREYQRTNANVLAIEDFTNVLVAVRVINSCHDSPPAVGAS